MKNHSRNSAFSQAEKHPSSSYFPENVGIFAEPRTNSLILLGPQDAIKRIEDFITQSVDVELITTIFAIACFRCAMLMPQTIANIMNEVTQFGAITEAGKSGGVRGGDKYMKPITFTPEPETNRLIIKGDYEDFLKAKEVIWNLMHRNHKLPLKYCSFAVTLNENKQLGAQMRSREPGSEGLLGTKCQMPNIRIIWH